MATSVPPTGPPPTPTKYAINNVKIFNVDTQRVSEPSTVVISRGVIMSINGSSHSPDPDATPYDGAGGVLLPGLIDAHVHIGSIADLDKNRKWGVTTVLDMEIFPPSAVSLLRSHAGRNGYPDLRTAGTPFTSSTETGAPLMPPDEAQQHVMQAVSERITDGSDYIKICLMPHLEPPQDKFTAAVKYAHWMGKKTVCHATTCAYYQSADTADVDMITHAPTDAVIDDRLVKSLHRSDRVDIPTLIMMQMTVDDQKAKGHTGTDYENARKSVTKMYEAGIPILSGTDANSIPGMVQPAHGSSLHDELKLLVDAGLSPKDALRSATILPAKAFGLNDRGKVVAGYRADLVLLKEDPTVNIENTKTLVQVWLNGVQFDPNNTDVSRAGH